MSDKTDKITDKIRKELFRMQDREYRDFQIKLIPTVDPETIIGTRTPDLRSFAKTLVKSGDLEEFLDELPHRYFDENQLHAFIISELKDLDVCIDRIDRFLPYVDNWATCDQMSPKIFKKHHDELIPNIKKWIASGKVYTVRFGVGMLMQYFLDDNFDAEYPETVAGIRSEEYYVNMMIAWYFATALAKQYESALPFIEGRRLGVWTHNKAVQKALESSRITPERKEYLKSLKIKNGGKVCPD